MSITLKGKHGRQDKTFANYSEALRWLADNNSQHGQRVNIHHFYVGSWQRGRDGGPATLALGGAYWFNQKLWTSEVTEEQFVRLAVLERRYASFYRYLTEVAPQWKTVDRIYWADNSVDAIQEASDGRRRTVQETAPHGDACF